MVLDDGPPASLRAASIPIPGKDRTGPDRHVMVLFLVALQRVPRELYQAAYLDGGSLVVA